MAINFTEIAFVPADWTLSSSSMTRRFVCEFLQVGEPLANKILSCFVSRRLLDYVFKLRGDNEIVRNPYLQDTLGGFC